MQFPPPPLIPHTPLTPLYEDEHLLAFDKPSGLLCVPGRGPDKQDCLSNRAQQQWPEALIVHRLDMATSGLVLMARSLEMQRAMSAAFAERKVHKTYEAIVHGQPENADAEWHDINAPILLDWERRPLHIIDPAGKPSQTQWKLLESPVQSSPAGAPSPWVDTDIQTSRLSLRPITGRTHQLRVHLRHIGWPILGDALYAPELARDASPRLLLHASELQFPHPVTQIPLHIKSAIPF